MHLSLRVGLNRRNRVVPVLVGMALAVGCKPAPPTPSNERPNATAREQVKQEAEALFQSVNEYSYAQKEEE